MSSVRTTRQPPCFVWTVHVDLEDVDEQLGPTKFIPNSHMAGRRPRQGEDNFHGVEAKSILARKGDCVMFRSYGCAPCASLHITEEQHPHPVVVLVLLQRRVASWQQKHIRPRAAHHTSALRQSVDRQPPKVQRPEQRRKHGCIFPGLPGDFRSRKSTTASHYWVPWRWSVWLMV